MSRPREFDEDVVRARVSEVFTAHGFNGTSLTMLMAASGLGKQSLYNAFGDKRQLYLQVVDASLARMPALGAAMAAQCDGMAEIRLVFDGLDDADAHHERAAHTCMMSIGLLESIDDPLIRDKLRALWQAGEDLLNAAVERGQRDGSVRADTPAHALSGYLMTLMSGLRISARVVDAPQLQQIVRQAFKLLAPPSGAT